MTSYFGILGKTPDLSLAELALVQPTNLTVTGGIASFDTAFPERLPLLGGLIKWGKKATFDELGKYTQGATVAGVDSQELGLMMKRTFGIRRYKEIELRKSDLDVKRKGVEIRSFGKKLYGVVQGRQNIDLYSEIDFEKPSHGMQIGMMPAKLAHILTNIGAGLVQNGLASHKSDLTVYDPFCGFGTINFIANYLGYHTIGSDSNITPSKQNHKRREKHSFFNAERMMTFFKHDVNDTFEKPFLSQVDVIVSEGRLGPVIKSEMHKHVDQTETILKEYIPSLVQLYGVFLEHSRQKMKDVPIVITIPEYLWLDQSIIADRISDHAKTLGYSVTYLGEVYKRKKQQVGRRVVIFQSPQ